MKGALLYAKPTGNVSAPAPPALTTIIEDTFTDSDATSLHSHTISPTNTPSTAWSEKSGDMKIVSNKVVVESATDRQQSTVDAGVADCTLSAKIASDSVGTTEAKYVGLVARWSATNKYWHISINAAADKFAIYEVTTERAVASVVLARATEYLLVATLLGESIAATLDGANNISYGSAAENKTATIHGIRLALTADSADDFKVTT